MKNSRIQNSSQSQLAENQEVNSTNERRNTEIEKGVMSENPNLDNSNQSKQERTNFFKTLGRANNRKENTKFNRKSTSSSSHSNSNLPNVDSTDYWAREINIDSQNIVKEESIAAVSGESATRPSRSQNIRAAPTFKAPTKDTSSSSSVSMKYNGSQSKASHSGKIPTKSESRNQVANKSVDTSSSVFRDDIDDDRLMKRSLVLHNIPEISDERRDQLGQAYLSLLHGGGGSALRWVSPSTCIIVFCSENLCQRGIDRSMRKPETAEFPPKLLSSIPELCSNDMLKGMCVRTCFYLSELFASFLFWKSFNSRSRVI